MLVACVECPPIQVFVDCGVSDMRSQHFSSPLLRIRRLLYLPLGIASPCGPQPVVYLLLSLQLQTPGSKAQWWKISCPDCLGRPPTSKVKRSSNSLQQN